MPFFKKSTPSVLPEWLVVGLGNPGAQYRSSRHNVGFRVVEILAQRHRLAERSECRALVQSGRIGGIPILLARPQTYMNLSGESVAPLVQQYGLSPDRVLVVTDELDLEVGRLRLRAFGSAGGHNGLKSLLHHLKTDQFPRLRIGVGRPKPEAGDSRTSVVDHVLTNFTGAEVDIIKSALESAADGVELVLSHGLQAAMNQINKKPSPPPEPPADPSQPEPPR